MGMSIHAVFCAGICVWVAVTPQAFSQAKPQSLPGKQQQTESHSRRAQEFLRNGQADLAVGEFRAILALDPNNVDARGNLGVTYFFQGDYVKAAPGTSQRNQTSSQPLEDSGAARHLGKAAGPDRQCAGLSGEVVPAVAGGKAPYSCRIGTD